MDDPRTPQPPKTPARRVRFKGRALKRNPFDETDVGIKTHAEEELEALERAEVDAPPPLEAEGMKEGCMGCLWVMALFFALLIGGIVINCVRQ